MPAISIRHEGTKTKILNIEKIAKSINRSAELILTFMSIELGTRVLSDGIAGKFTESRLQEIIYSFLDIFVNCLKCKNPETILEKKKKTVKRCIACGYTQTNINHKATSCIPIHKELKTCDDYVPAVDDVDNDDDWCEDVSEEAVKQRMQQLSTFTKRITVSSDTLKQRVDFFYEFAKINDVINFKKEISRLDLNDYAIIVIVELFFDSNQIKSLEKYKSLFLYLNKSVKSQFNMLMAIEKRCIEQNNLEKLMKIFVYLYDNDMVEDVTFIDWANKSSKLTQNTIKKFIDWLKTPDTDDEDDIVFKINNVIVQSDDDYIDLI
jgi:translation initiation factor 5